MLRTTVLVISLSTALTGCWLQKDEPTNPDDVSSDAGTADASTGGALADLSIVDLQNPSSAGHPAENSRVAIRKVVVTAIDAQPDGARKGFWVQEPNGGAYSGIYVYRPLDSTVPIESLTRGDEVDVEGTYVEFYGLSELSITAAVKTGVAAEPAPADISGSTADAVLESWEGVLVRFCGPCTVTAPADGHGEVATTCARLDNDLYSKGLFVGDSFACVQGILNYTFGTYKLLPRGEADFLAVAP